METELNLLEEKIGRLIAFTQSLRAENQTLRTNLAQALADNNQLRENMAMASSRVEALIERLPPEMMDNETLGVEALSAEIMDEES